MKKFALYHIEEELYLNEITDGYELDSDRYLFTNGELEYMFVNKHEEEDCNDETITCIGGDEYHQSDFELITYKISEMKRINFGEIKLE